jgi:hypothetical protein
MAQHSLARTFGWIALALVAFEGLRHLPDLVRYIKIERM